MKRYIIAATMALALAACDQSQIATPQTQPFPDAAPRVYIVNIADGDTVTAPFRVVFGLSGMGVAPAGIDKPNTGHHHLLVDTTLTAEQRAYAIPADENHIHFGGGQTETVLNLPPGDHTLQLVLANRDHALFNPSVESEVITIHVQ